MQRLCNLTFVMYIDLVKVCNMIENAYIYFKARSSWNYDPLWTHKDQHYYIHKINSINLLAVLQCVEILQWNVPIQSTLVPC